MDSNFTYLSWGAVFGSNQIVTQRVDKFGLWSNKPKDLKVAKEDQRVIGSMVNGLDGR